VFIPYCLHRFATQGKELELATVDFFLRQCHWYSGERNDCRLSPTIFRYRNYRFYFFSREESRIHVHVISPDGEAKFRLEPKIELAVNKNPGSTELKELQQIVEERHFKS
jgi:hypothetical protein